MNNVNGDVESLSSCFQPINTFLNLQSSCSGHRDLIFSIETRTYKAPSTRIRGFLYPQIFFSDTPSVHTCPPYTVGVSGAFCIRSPEWKFLNTLCIRVRVDARICIFSYTLTSQYQSFSARALLTYPLRCPDTNRIRVDGRIRFAYTTCERRYFCIRIKTIENTKISGYVWTGPKALLPSHLRALLDSVARFLYTSIVRDEGVGVACEQARVGEIMKQTQLFIFKWHIVKT